MAVPTLLKAALPSIPVVNQLPGIRKTGAGMPELVETRYDVPVDRVHVVAYSEVCGFPLKDHLPLTYPHVLAFPLQMAIMTDRSFPFPAIGTVHLENAITASRPIAVDENVDLAVWAENLRPHRRGQQADLVSEATVDGEVVWRGVSTSDSSWRGWSGVRVWSDSCSSCPLILIWIGALADR